MKKFLHSKVVFCAVIALLVGAVGTAHAKSPQNMGPDTTNRNENIIISFNGADVLDVIRWASDLTEKNIIVSNRVKKKPITVIAGEPMSKEEAYEAFLAIMQVNDYVVVETDTALKIFEAQNAKANTIPLINDKGNTPEDFVMHIIKIKNVSAQQLASLLKPLVPNSAHFQTHPGTNILLIADYKSNIEKIVRLVEQIDQAGTIDVEFIQLEHASAKEVVELISSLVPKIVGKDAKDAPAQALNFAADERSNSILMSGDTVLRTQMKKLIEKLDQPIQGDGNTQVIYLNYADATEMVDMLKGVGGSVIKSEEAAGGTPAFANSEFNVIASEANNALVITAAPSLLATIKSVIEKLDIRREQVLVEALLVEVNEDIGRELGVYWGSDSATTTGWQATGGFSPGSGVNFDATAGTNPITGTTPSGAGLLASYFRNGNLRGVINALESDTESNILSTPTIVALDNEEAEILVGENVPFITSETSDLGGSNSRVSVERQDVGLHLKVKAKINLNDTLTLEIEQKVESVVEGVVKDAVDLVTTKRELKTKAIVDDNDILVLGGLIRDESVETESKVPFLGDIPILGWLFKGTKKTMVKKNLMILIHPRILRDRTDSVRESIEIYGKMQMLQDYYNADTDWLTIRPRQLPKLEELPETMTDDGTLYAEPELRPTQVVEVDANEAPAEEPVSVEEPANAAAPAADNSSEAELTTDNDNPAVEADAEDTFPADLP